tara:strand:- start:1784 stop:2992 length:1209 start_codon:yes stop_codon:yes gene_type:complete
MSSGAPQTLGGRGHKYGFRVKSVAWSPDGNMLASASTDKTIIIWNTVNEKLIHTLIGHSAGVYSVAWNPIINILASGSIDKTIKIWDVLNGDLLHTLQLTDISSNVAWSPNGKVLTNTVHLNHGLGQPWSIKVNLWHVPMKRDSMFQILSGRDGISGLVEPLNRDVVGMITDKAVTWTIDDVINIGDNFVYFKECKLAWSLSGDVLACGCGTVDRYITLWEMTTRTTSMLIGHSDRVNDVAWSPVGDVLASGSWDNTIKIWNTATKTCSQTLIGHTEGVNSVSFNPGSEFLASASGDCTIKIWNYAKGVLIRTLKPRYPLHTQRVFLCVAWSPAGNILASGAVDGIVRLWGLYSKRNRIYRILSGRDGRSALIGQLNADVVGMVSDEVAGPGAAAHFNLLVV